MAHTPGPWETEELKIISQGGPLIAYANEEPDNDLYPLVGEEVDANARLIAASPDLLAACKDVADIIQGGDRLETCEPWAQDVISRLRNAIAKAEG
jgi:hypothetical protein